MADKSRRTKEIFSSRSTIFEKGIHLLKVLQLNKSNRWRLYETTIRYSTGTTLFCVHFLQKWEIFKSGQTQQAITIAHQSWTRRPQQFYSYCTVLLIVRISTLRQISNFTPTELVDALLALCLHFCRMSLPQVVTAQVPAMTLQAYFWVLVTTLASQIGLRCWRHGIHSNIWNPMQLQRSLLTMTTFTMTHKNHPSFDFLVKIMGLGWDQE